MNAKRPPASVAGSSRPRRDRGQAMLEYILLMACLSVLAIGFAKFMGEQMFSRNLGSGRLPDKVGFCVTHEKARAEDCR